MSTTARPAVVGALGAVAWLLAFAAIPASANHHFMKVREVFAGAVGQPSAQFVELQMHAPGQTVMAGKQIVVYDAAGATIDTFTFPANVANGANQSSILIATTQAASFFGVTPDLTMTPVIPAAGGKVCFIRPSPLTVWDCVAWGNYTGSSTGVGTPFNQAGGLVTGSSALRDISGGTNPNTLEAADDTNNSTADFDLADASPRNNAGATTTTAGQASVGGGTLSYTAATGSVVNNVTLSGPSAGFYTLRDTAAPITLGAGCQRVGVNEARCASGGVFQSDLSSGPANDIMAVSTTIPTTLTGGTGNDKLTGGNGGDTLLGVDGQDILGGGNGADTLNGGLNNDTLTGSAGPDVHIGGGGVDTASYAGRSASVTVDIDGVADDGSVSDGPAGARDNITADVENLTGGNAGDTLIGSAGTNILNGGTGPDILSGLAGIDTVTYFGRTTAVTVDIDGVADDGGAPDGPVGARDRVDTDIQNIVGGSAADTLTGNSAVNKLTGGPGADSMEGREGNDTLVAKDGVVDTEINCDGGATAGLADKASVDPADPATTGCETVTN